MRLASKQIYIDKGRPSRLKEEEDKKAIQEEKKQEEIKQEEDKEKEEEKKEKEEEKEKELNKKFNQKKGFFNSIKDFFKGDKKKKKQENKQQQQIQQEIEIDVEDVDVDTNIGFIQFKDYLNKKKTIQEKIVKCQQCESILNIFSQIDDQNIWNCEFCEFQNKVKTNKEFLKVQQESEDILYVLENLKPQKIEVIEAEKEEEDKEKVKPKDQTITMFVLDNSGSMAGELKKCVDQAILKQFELFIKQKENRTVGIIIFDSIIYIIGDGLSNETITINKDKTDNKKEIQNLCKNKINTLIDTSKGIMETKEILTQKILQQIPTGCTALGPAVLSAYYLLEEAKLGSQIILCTDGLANEGLGKLESIGVDEGKKFYIELAENAQKKGIQISIITVKGRTCKVDDLMVLSEKTGGMISRVDPANMDQDLEYILQDKVFTQQAQLVIQLSFQMQFRNANDDFQLNEGKNKLSKQLMNPSINNEITFEFNIIDQYLQAQIKHVYFQSRVEYVQDDQKLLRVVTQKLECTEDKKQVELKADLEIIQKRITQQTAYLAMNNKNKEAEQYGKMWSKNMVSNVNYNQNQDQKVFNEQKYSDTKQLRMANKQKYQKSQQMPITQERSKIQTQKRAFKQEDEDQEENKIQINNKKKQQKNDSFCVSDEENQKQMSDDGCETMLYKNKK